MIKVEDNVPNCTTCGQTVVRLQSNTEKNKGRDFFKCETCDAFLWADYWKGKDIRGKGWNPATNNGRQSLAKSTMRYDQKKKGETSASEGGEISSPSNKYWYYAETPKGSNKVTRESVEQTTQSELRMIKLEARVASVEDALRGIASRKIPAMGEEKDEERKCDESDDER
jgi:hypothetical protein